MIKKKKKNYLSFPCFQCQGGIFMHGFGVACPSYVSQLLSIETCSYLLVFFLGGSRLLEFEI